VDSGRLDRWRMLLESVVKPLSSVFPSLKGEMEKELAYLGSIRRGARVLDVGCGSGDALSLYRECGASIY
jgi:2-polyprenyl-3-methyl-5-hydroxy-6-metoxy-1,4-benzoquinol methylase